MGTHTGSAVIKIVKKQTAVIIILFFVICFFLAGCVGVGNSLYRWGRYQDTVYMYLNGGSLESQISIMEKDLQKIVSGTVPAPPGFYAHLGMLHSETGNPLRAVECFTEEKTLFPESAAFMDRLLSAYGN